jgi:hypothetical protein
MVAGRGRALLHGPGHVAGRRQRKLSAHLQPSSGYNVHSHRCDLVVIIPVLVFEVSREVVTAIIT